MLYVTTRINADAFTAHRALTENRGPEGGLYLPMRLPELSVDQIRALGEESFGQNVADVMNLLFNTELDGWAVEFSIGRYPMRMVSLGNKVTVAEYWHNPQWHFDRLMRNLSDLVLGDPELGEPSDWMAVASRIAMLFGTYGEMLHAGMIKAGDLLDVVVPSQDFSPAMAAFYARKLGLPLGNIVISCNENSTLWSLFHQGVLRTDTVAISTKLPKCDHGIVPGLERLICSVLGTGEALRFRDVCRVGGDYCVSEQQMKLLSKGLRVSVVSQHRTESMIRGIYKSFGYIPDPYTALAYSGLMDYRSGTGEGRPALILSEESPAFSVDMIGTNLGIGKRELKERIDRS